MFLLCNFTTSEFSFKMFSKLFVAYLLFTFATYFAFGATLLPKEEVQALRDIGKTIGKADWDFDADPCSGGSGWNTSKPEDASFANGIACNCSFSDAPACHVVAIILKGQSLQGMIPPELARLPYLQEIDLTRNYLNGTLPKEWGTMKLVKINLNANRISGSIPKEFGNITTLRELVLEYNQLTGGVPPELGDHTQIERIVLTSNNLSGELPPELAKLTTLTDFRIGDNNFTGNVPDYIKRWTNLEKLFIEGSGLNGPIPDIADLVNLVELRISDLNGPEQPFPSVYNFTKMKTLILRNCNIRDKLPEYLGNLSAKLRLIDLSFNKLSGRIPDTYALLSNVDYTYLTGNLLNESVPHWMPNKGDNLDLSYNNFRVISTESCQDKSVNLFANSLKGNNSRIVPCLQSITCPKRLYYSVHINCGGGNVPIGKDTIYEADTDSAGPAKFFLSTTNWAFSNTGHFLDDKRSDESYTWTNKSALSNNIKDSGLYMTARLSPLSLTYYGFCLGYGNYTVQLHFAEIMFTDDNTYNSLGRRIFDVYIQGKLVLENFNIAAEAGGVRKAIVKNFTTPVTNNTLEIRFYWAGKGTTGIPTTGVYGPLVSAISVEPQDFEPPAEESSATSSVGKIIGIVAGVGFFILVVLGILWWKGCIGKKDTMAQDLKGLDLQTGTFSLRQLKAATNNFDHANKIGEGGFGSVYMGTLLDGTVIAVKQLSSKSKQGNREFVNEIGMISALEHPHLVKLYGCCTQGNQLLLVYEYMENNSLARALFGPAEHQLRLDWPTRHRICVGIARGLAYLHEESILKIVHRDIKATNVLLDKDLNPKISDFGLAKLDEEENTHISTRIAGTYGYMAPEYAMRGYLTDKADVYSFGIVALEIVSGRSNTLHRSKDDSFNLLDWALILKEKGSLMELVDTRLGLEFNKEQVMEMVNVGLLCTNITAAARPTMSSVVSMLEGRTKVPELASDSSSAAYEERKFMAMKKQYELSEDSMSDVLLQTESMCGPSTTSSTSARDLYSIHVDSDYLEKRDQR